MRTLLLLVCAATLTLSGAPVADAGGKKKPSRASIKKAQWHFGKARTHQKNKRYDAAIRSYLKAYALYPSAEFYFNVGEAYRLKGDPANAIVYFERYLELDRRGRAATAARQTIKKLRAEIAKRKADEELRQRERANKEQAARDKAARDKAARDKAAQDREARRNADEDRLQEEANDRTANRRSRSGRGKRLLGLGTAGIGAALVGVGIVFGLKAKKIDGEAADWDVFDRKRFEQGESAERNMFIFTGVGAAALIGGGVVYYLGARQRGTTGGEKSLSWLPAVTPQTVTFSAAGRF